MNKQRERMMRDVDEDIRAHIETETQDNIARGTTPEAARHAAMKKFGNVALVREDTRNVWTLVWLEQFLQDVRYGLRSLRKSPGFTAIAVLTLALGIGANTAIFSVVNSTLLAPLPFTDSARLVNLWGHSEQFDFPNLGLSLPDIEDIRAQSSTLASITPYTYRSVDLSGRMAPKQLDSASVPAGFFETLGLHPLYGRTFTDSETSAGQDRVAILSGSLWRDEFGADPRIVGTDITLDKKSYRVIGVMPPMPQIFSPASVDIWTPFVVVPGQAAQRGMHGTLAIARLKPGVTVAQAQAELDGIAARLAKAYPGDDQGWSFRVNSMRGDIGHDTRVPLMILLGAVGFVLLIACANVGNLFLSRGWARRRELALRATLGAARGRLIRQLLVECGLLAFAGGACGLLLALWGVDALKTLLPSSMQLIGDLQINLRVLFFTMGLSLLAGLLFGLAPAFLFSQYDLTTAMKECGAGSQSGASSREHHPLRQLLVVTEMALALVLVVGATLALRSFSHMLRADFGFETERVLALHLDFPEAKFNNRDEMFSYVRAATERLAATPGVESVVAASNGPLSSRHNEATFRIEDAHADSKSQLSANWHSVAPGYFETLAIPILRGRDFNALDGKDARAVVVSQSFARAFFDVESVIGKRISTDEDAQHHPIWSEIVGEVADVREVNPRIEPKPTIYVPFFDASHYSGVPLSVELLLRTRTDAAALIPSVERQLWNFDAGQPVAEALAMNQRVAHSVASPRFQSFLLGAFGALGLLLATVGIYGLISYSVSQRTHEIGLRMALGAEPQSILNLVLSQGMKLALAGIAIGIVASLALTRLMSSLLFGVSATDPLTFVGVALLLAGVAALASYLPARRAMRVDPMVALRYE
jgi:putative ABC transport system permease protein